MAARFRPSAASLKRGAAETGAQAPAAPALLPVLLGSPPDWRPLVAAPISGHFLVSIARASARSNSTQPLGHVLSVAPKASQSNQTSPTNQPTNQLPPPASLDTNENLIGPGQANAAHCSYGGGHQQPVGSLQRSSQQQLASEQACCPHSSIIGSPSTGLVLSRDSQRRESFLYRASDNDYEVSPKSVSRHSSIGSEW